MAIKAKHEVNGVADQIAISLKKLKSFVDSDGVREGEAAENAVAETIEWLRYLKANAGDGTACELLDGTRAFVIEAVAYISLGMGRAAVSAIRGQIDLLLSYTYFRDHPSEWAVVCGTGDGFKLRSQIYKYHEETTRDFKFRRAAVEDVAPYDLKRIYHILSSHIHGQTVLTIPQTDTIDAVILSPEFVRTIVELQRQTTFALSNFLTVVYAPHWPELPPNVIRRVKGLVKPSQRHRFFTD